MSPRDPATPEHHRVFGGNSNWRGPIWFPMNFLLIQAVATFARYYGDSFTLECPTGSSRQLTLAEIADELSRRRRAAAPVRRQPVLRPSVLASRSDGDRAGAEPRDHRKGNVMTAI